MNNFRFEKATHTKRNNTITLLLIIISESVREQDNIVANRPLAIHLGWPIYPSLKRFKLKIGPVSDKKIPQ